MRYRLKIQFDIYSYKNCVPRSLCSCRLRRVWVSVISAIKRRSAGCLPAIYKDSWEAVGLM